MIHENVDVLKVWIFYFFSKLLLDVLVPVPLSEKYYGVSDHMLKLIGDFKVQTTNK